jgi:hypothetical protein
MAPGITLTADIPQMYTDVEISCRFAQYYSLKIRWILSYCPTEKIGGIFVYICGKWVTEKIDQIKIRPSLLF